MADQSNVSLDDRPAYDPPRAFRMVDMHPGPGSIIVCAGDGSGDAQCNSDGSGADHCSAAGNGPVEPNG